VPDLAAVDRRLRQILAPYRGRYTLRASEQGLALELPGHEGDPWGFVAGTRMGKRYVSFYLMTVYARPELMDKMSPELRRRMQGKSCFNFATVDERLLGELEALTARSIEGHAAVAAQAIERRRKRR
jgi:hypothetical protein